jgi:hypothetical protein
VKGQRPLLAATALCLLLGIGWWVRCQAEPAPPVPIGGPPSTAGANDAPRPADASLERLPDGGAGPRQSPPPTAADALVTLRVRVVASDDAPLDGVEVDVEVAADGVASAGADEAEADRPAPARYTAITDREGRVRFELGRCAGRTAQLRTALSGDGSRTVALTPTTVDTEIVLPIAHRALVTGSVVDGSGVGIAGAELLLLPWGEPDAPLPAPRRVGRSGADGRFQLQLATGGRLGAQHDRYGPSPLHLVKAAPRGGPPSTTNLQLQLADAMARLHGCVVDAAGRPVAAARIYLRSTNPTPRSAELPAPPRWCTADAGGEFLADQLAPGAVQYEVRAAGHGLLRGPRTLVAGRNPPVRLQLPPACAVTGIATDVDGQPLDAARIVANDSSGPIASTRTAADGSYRLVDLPSGPVALVATARADHGAKLQAAAEVELAPSRVPTWNPQLQPVAADRQLRSQLFDHRGQALAGHTVVAQGSGRMRATAPTNVDGTFAVGAPGTGLIDVGVFAPGRPTNLFANGVWRQLDPANPPARLELEPIVFGTLIGRVETSDRQPVQATIGVWHERTGEYVEFHSSADGTFRLGEVPPGRVSLHCAAAGLPAHKVHDVMVPEGSVLELPTIVMAAGARFSVVVTDANGAPATGCELRLLGPDGALQATWEQGEYVFAAAPAGPVQLQISGPGFAPVLEALTLQPGQALRREVRLMQGVRRRVLVQVPAGAGDTITLRVQQAGQPTPFQTTAPVVRPNGGGGALHFEVWMAPGTYQITAIGSSGWVGQKPVEFGHDSSDVQIVLQRNR